MERTLRQGEEVGSEVWEQTISSSWPFPKGEAVAITYMLELDLQNVSIWIRSFG